MNKSDRQIAITAVAPLRKTEKVVLGFWDGEMLALETMTGKRVQELTGHDGRVSVDGKKCVSAFEDRTLRVW